MIISSEMSTAPQTQRQYFYSIAQSLYGPCSGAMGMTWGVIRLLRRTATPDPVLSEFFDTCDSEGPHPKDCPLFCEFEWPPLTEGPTRDTMDPAKIAYLEEFVAFLRKYERDGVWNG